MKNRTTIGPNNYTYNPSNHHKIINNDKFMTRYLYPKIEQRINGGLHELEKMWIIKDVKGMDMNYFARFKTWEEILYNISGHIAKKVMKKRREKNKPIKNIDHREYVKASLEISTESPATINKMLLLDEYDEGKDTKEEKNNISGISGTSGDVNVKTFMGLYRKEDILNLLNPSELHRYRYIYLDTRFRNTSESDGTREFVWDYINSSAVSPGSINGVGYTQNIIAMKVADFTIPRTSTGDYNTNLITMGVKEWFSQSFICHENHNFHISFFPTVDENLIRLNAHDMLDGNYYFNNPITQLTRITILFGAPLQRIIFDKDRLSSTIIAAQNSLITTSENHNLDSGDFVIVDTYTTNSPQNDTISISNINNPRGYPITVVSDTQFTIPIDLTPVKPVIEGTSTLTTSGDFVGIGTDYLTDMYIGQFVLTELVPGDDSLQPNGAFLKEQITTITNNSLASIGVARGYIAADVEGKYVQPQLTGTVAAGSVVINVDNATFSSGTTLFAQELKVGDIVDIFDSLDRRARETILSITSNGFMTTTNEDLKFISPPISGTMVLFKNNTIDNFSFTTYFQSKRIMIPMELKFITEKLSGSG